MGSVNWVLKLEFLKLLFLFAIRLPLFSFPLHPVVVLGLPAGQHHHGVHQDAEEDSFLSRLWSPDDAAIQCCWQSLKILEVAFVLGYTFGPCTYSLYKTITVVFIYVYVNQL